MKVDKDPKTAEDQTPGIAQRFWNYSEQVKSEEWSSMDTVWCVTTLVVSAVIVFGVMMLCG